MDLIVDRVSRIGHIFYAERYTTFAVPIGIYFAIHANIVGVGLQIDAYGICVAVVPIAIFIELIATCEELAITIKCEYVAISISTIV